jgi:hypothetical protein
MWDYGISERDLAADDTEAVAPVRFGTVVPSAVSAFETTVAAGRKTGEGSEWLELSD